MKRNELTVGMVVAVKHGYGEGKKATVVSLDKHKVGYSGRVYSGQGTGLLVKLLGGYNEDLVVVQPQAVLGEWTTYAAEQKAAQEERAKYAAQAADLQRQSMEAEMAAVERAKEFGLRISREYSKYGGRVSMTTAQLQALLDALPEGTTFAQAAQ